MACNRFPWIFTHNAYLHSMKSSMYILPYGRRFWMPFPDYQLAVNGANSSWHIAAQSGCQQPFVASFEVIKSKYALWQRSLLSGKLQRVHTTKSISIFIITDLYAYAYIFYIYIYFLYVFVKLLDSEPSIQWEYSKMQFLWCLAFDELCIMSRLTKSSNSLA